MLICGSESESSDGVLVECLFEFLFEVLKRAKFEFGHSEARFKRRKNNNSDFIYNTIYQIESDSAEKVLCKFHIKNQRKEDM